MNGTPEIPEKKIALETRACAKRLRRLMRKEDNPEPQKKRGGSEANACEKRDC